MKTGSGQAKVRGTSFGCAAMAAVDSTVGAPRRTGCGQQFPAQVEKLLHDQVGEIVGAQVALRLLPDQLDPAVRAAYNSVTAEHNGV
jgi:hypothetical protein